MAIADFFTQVQTPQSTAPMPTSTGVSGATTLQENLALFANPNSEFRRNARQRGIEYAATRGGVNSSIAAGAAERNALEQTGALATAATNIDTQRQTMFDQAALNDWTAAQGFNREFQGQLSMLPVASSFNMMSALQQFALQDPALFTPDVVSGYSQFFTQNMNDVLSRYFGSGTS